MFFHLQIMCLILFFQRMAIEILFNKKIQIFSFEVNLHFFQLKKKLYII
jgi:hypothetical protein